MRRSPKLLLLASATAAALVLGGVTSASATPASADTETLAAPDVDVNDVLTHLAQFQDIADRNGNRASGTPGYAESADYVAQTLSDAGYEVTRQTCTSCTSPDDNIIADWPGGDENATIMLGAHLDGVSRGPGSNDNGTGSAALVQVALELAAAAPDTAKHVRFGWWADEEQGLNGSSHYVDNGGTEGLEVYLNFDMIGSPNAGYFVDGLDNPYGALFGEHLDSVGKSPDPMWECCSDDMPFAAEGVTTAFLSTGASATMTSDQAAKWGGTAGESFDRCYHSACDSYPDNINTEALDHTTDAIAYALWALAVDV